MRVIITIIIAALFANKVQAQKCWKQRTVGYVITKTKCNANTNISKFDTWQLNYKKLKKQASRAKPQSQKENNVIIELPIENGIIKKFRIFDAETMSPDLSKQFPEIRSYFGQCVDDKLLSVRLDINDLGFHALVSNSQGLQWLVEPFCKSTTQFYCTYHKADYKSEREPFNEERRR